MLLKVYSDIKFFLLGCKEYGPEDGGLQYPIDLDFTLERESEYYSPKDPHGVPMKLYRSVGKHYNPTRVAAFALANYNRHLNTGDKRSREAFLDMAKWFMGSTNGCWYYRFDWNDLRAPWLSCMSQGEGISVLVRAYLLTKDSTYLERAILAAETFSKPTTEGGVLGSIDTDSPFLEEYPSINPDHVLNGFLYALIGLLDLHEFCGIEKKALNLDKLLATLSKCIAMWDLGYWSAYDLRHKRGGAPNPCTAGYHNLQITQLLNIAKRTANDDLMAVAQRWDNYAKRPKNRVRAMFGKIAFRIKTTTQR